MTKKSTYNRPIQIILGVCSMAIFIFACWLYVSFRSTDMVLYKWLGVDCNTHLFQLLRITNYQPPSWLIYNLPDCLWMLSFLFLMECIWGDEKLKWIFVWCMLGFAYIFETMQYLHVSLCTGDVWDFISYTIAMVLYILFNKLKFISYEKKH